MSIDVTVSGLNTVVDVTMGAATAPIDVDVGQFVIIDNETYAKLPDKPLIEGVVLEGNKSFEELNLSKLTNQEIEELLII